jgi:hypothetical protein
MAIISERWCADDREAYNGRSGDVMFVGRMKAVL